MAYAKIVFEKDPKSKSNFLDRIHGNARKAPVGFSWTTLFFLWWVPSGRGDYKWTVIMVLCDLPLFLTGNPAFLLFRPIYAPIFSFIYNKIYIKGLVKDGWKAKSLASASPSDGPDPLGALLDSLKVKWGMEIPRMEEEKTNGREEK